MYINFMVCVRCVLNIGFDLGKNRQRGFRPEKHFKWTSAVWVIFFHSFSSSLQNKELLDSMLELSSHIHVQSGIYAHTRRCLNDTLWSQHITIDGYRLK